MSDFARIAYEAYYKFNGRKPKDYDEMGSHARGGWTAAALAISLALLQGDEDPRLREFIVRQGKEKYAAELLNGVRILGWDFRIEHLPGVPEGGLLPMRFALRREEGGELLGEGGEWFDPLIRAAGHIKEALRARLPHELETPVLSTGMPSNLRSYRLLAQLIGEKAVAFIDRKIEQSPHGELEPVLADEYQMIQLLAGAQDREDV